MIKLIKTFYYYDYYYDYYEPLLLSILFKLFFMINSIDISNILEISDAHAQCRVFAGNPYSC